MPPNLPDVKKDKRILGTDSAPAPLPMAPPIMDTRAPIDAGISSGFMGDPGGRQDVTAAISRSAAGAPKIDDAFMGTARSLAMGEGGQATAAVQSAREQALRDIMSQRAGGRNAALSQVGASRAMGVAQGQLAQQAHQAGLAEQAMGLKLGAGMSQAEAQIEADLEKAANAMLTELLSQGVRLDVAKMQVEAERERQRSQLMYDYWAKVADDQRAREIAAAEIDEETKGLRGAHTPLPTGIGWGEPVAASREPDLIYNPATGRLEPRRGRGGSPDFESGPYDTGEGYTHQEYTQGIGGNLDREAEEMRLDVESKRLGLEKAEAILGGISTAANVGGLAMGLAGRKSEREAAIQAAATGAGTQMAQRGIEYFAGQMAERAQPASFVGPPTQAAQSGLDAARTLGGAAVPIASLAGQGARILASDASDKEKLRQGAHATGGVGAGYLGGMAGGALGTALGGPVGGYLGGAAGGAIGSGLANMGMNKLMPPRKRFSYGADYTGIPG